jgi:HEAT repeat protein
MKAFAALAFAAALAYVLWQKGVLKQAPPPPPPPPPPPAILNEPAPVISAQELRKVMNSAQDPDPKVRWQAVLFLDKIKAPQAMPLMQHMLQKDMDSQLRINILNLLAKRKGPDVVATVFLGTKDLEPEVRLAALQALEQIGDFSVASSIANGPLLSDQDDRVRLQAMKTLNTLQDMKQKEIEAARQRYEAEKEAAAAAARQQK